LKVYVSNFSLVRANFKNHNLKMEENLQLFLPRFEPWTFKLASQHGTNSAMLTPKFWFTLLQSGFED
jgi:hypothetical protein